MKSIQWQLLFRLHMQCNKRLNVNFRMLILSMNRYNMTEIPVLVLQVDPFKTVNIFTLYYQQLKNPFRFKIVHITRHLKLLNVCLFLTFGDYVLKWQ